MFTTIAFIIGFVAGWFVCQKLEDITEVARTIADKIKFWKK